jgi:hypothetical protein
MRRRLLVSAALSLSLAAAAPSAMVFAAPVGAQPADHECDDRGNAAALERCAPEAPFPVGLPIAGLAVFGGYVWLVRRSSALRDAVNTSAASL